MRYMKTFTTAALLAVAVTSSAFAADANALKKKSVVIPESAVKQAAVPASAKPRLDSVSITFGPEMYATSDYHNNHGKPSGEVKDWATKFSYSHTFENNVVLGGSVAYTAWYNDLEAKANHPASTLNKTAFEASAGYKIKLDTITITPALGLGYVAGWAKVNNLNNDPSTNAACSTTNSSSTDGDCFKPEPYYFFTLAMDWKVTSDLTWNVVNLRYRDAWDGNWNTPAIGTGLSYNLTSDDAITVSTSYSWANKWSHTVETSSKYADSYNVMFGYKHAFNIF